MTDTTNEYEYDLLLFSLIILLRRTLYSPSNTNPTTQPYPQVQVVAPCSPPARQ